VCSTHIHAHARAHAHAHAHSLTHTHTHTHTRARAYDLRYALTAAHVLIASYVEVGDSAALLRAAAVLDRAVAASGYNMQLRLLAARTHTMLGSAAPAWLHWAKCDVKQIQLDSIA
jgi:hypothetical protein